MTTFAQLKAPFPADAISWRIGSTTKDKSKGMALAYIDARDVMDRLDDIVGADCWRDEYQEIAGFVVCKLWLKINGEWTWKCDGAGKTDVEAEKGMLSDAFKRSAVKWGIGRYLYSLDSPWVKINEFRQIDKEEYPRLRQLLACNGAPAALTPPPADTAPTQAKAAGHRVAALVKAEKANPAPAPAKATKPAAPIERPNSGRVAANLMTAVTKRMAALMRDPGSLATITSDHEGWKIEAKERWLEMTGVDQRRVTKALEPFLVALETATERATKGKPKHKATETYDPDTGEIPGEVGEAA